MLNWMKKGFPMFAALAAGHIGGALNTLINQGRPAATIRAYRFEVAGESGRTVAVWGREPSGAQASDSGTALVFNDQRGGRRLEMGTSAGNNAPFLRLFGEEGGRGPD